MKKGSVRDSSSDSRGRGLMRRHSGGVRAAVAGAAVLASLVFVGSALAVSITSFTPHSGLPAKDNGEACPGNTIQITGTGFVSDGAPVTVAFGGVNTPVVQIGSDNTIYAVVPDGAKTGPLTVSHRASSKSSR